MLDLIKFTVHGLTSGTDHKEDYLLTISAWVNFVFDKLKGRMILLFNDLPYGDWTPVLAILIIIVWFS